MSERGKLPENTQAAGEVDQVDRLIDAAARELANPAIPLNLNARLRQRSLQMQSTMNSGMNLPPAIAGNAVLLFSTSARTRVQRDPRTVGSALLLHAAALLLIGLGIHSMHPVVTVEPVRMVALLAPVAPPPAPPKVALMGGGGGQKGPTPVTKGNPPRFAAEQLNPPRVQPLEEAKVTVPVTVDVQKDLKMSKVDVPQFGMPNSPLVGMSMGNGSGGGLGSGRGNGLGSGSGGNMGGGVRRIGGGVSAPVVLFAPEPEFSEEARKAKVAGNVLVYLQVDTNGNPTHVRVIKGIGMGLDEKAMEAVHKYKFKPAMEDGRPVPVEMNVEVNFQIF